MIAEMRKKILQKSFEFSLISNCQCLRHLKISLIIGIRIVGDSFTQAAVIVRFCFVQVEEP